MTGTRETGEPFDTALARAELDPSRPRPIETPWGTMALFDLGGEVVCVQAFCPHLLGPLFQGSVAGGAVTCPWHAWRFDLKSGDRIDFPRTSSARLARCRVRVSERGTIVLDPPSDGAALDREG
jgi:nitrite reductase (NADH) small subunit